MDRRLKVVLRTPNAPLTSADAAMILDGFNSVDSVSLVASLVMMRRTVASEIEDLEGAEGIYGVKQNEAIRSLDDFDERERAMKQAEVNAAAVAEVSYCAVAGMRYFSALELGLSPSP